MRIYLTSEAYKLAEEFAKEQVSPEKSRSIYLNTLSVYAVNRYLNTFDIKTDFGQGDWRNLLWRSLFDTADLLIGQGCKIECRPVLFNQTYMNITEKSEEVVGYVAVQFSENLDSVDLIGFASATAIVNGNYQIALSNLQPIEDVLDQTIPVVRLWQWAQGIATNTWQAVDGLMEEAATQIRDLLPQPEIAFRLRQPMDEDRICRFREIVVSHHCLKLVIDRIPQENTSKIQIVVKVCPIENLDLIPTDLRLIVSSGETTLKPVVREVGNFIEKRFMGEPGERFNLCIIQGDVSFTESYEI